MTSPPVESAETVNEGRITGWLASKTVSTLWTVSCPMAGKEAMKRKARIEAEMKALIRQVG
jgi:hypothetical protein